MSNDDFCLRDDEGNPINLDSIKLKYVMGRQLIIDLYSTTEIEERQKTLTIFLHELASTLTGIIGGVSKKNRNQSIQECFFWLDIVKTEVIDNLNRIEENEKNK